MSVSVKDLSQTLGRLITITFATDTLVTMKGVNSQKALAFYDRCFDAVLASWELPEDLSERRGGVVRDLFHECGDKAARGFEDEDATLALDAAETLVKGLLRENILIHIQTGETKEEATESVRNLNRGWIAQDDGEPFPIVEGQPWSTVASSICAFLVSTLEVGTNPRAAEATASVIMNGFPSYLSLLVSNLGSPFVEAA